MRTISRKRRIGTELALAAVMMLPPDTDEIVSSFASTPVSFSRRRAPR